MKDAQIASSIRTAELEAERVKGENEAAKLRAASDAMLQVARSEAYQKGETSQKQSEAAVVEAENLARAKAAQAEAKRIEEEKRAELEAPAKALKAKAIIDSEARASQVKIEADADAQALLAKYRAEARGEYERLARKAEGLGMIVQNCGGADKVKAISLCVCVCVCVCLLIFSSLLSSPIHILSIFFSLHQDTHAHSLIHSLKAFQLLMLEQLQPLAAESAKAISNIKFDKVVVWENGGDTGGSSTSNFVRNLTSAVPPAMDVLKHVGGFKNIEKLMPGVGTLDSSDGIELNAFKDYENQLLDTFRGIFDMYDHNRDGRIDGEEFESLLSSPALEEFKSLKEGILDAKPSLLSTLERNGGLMFSDIEDLITMEMKKRDGIMS